MEKMAARERCILSFKFIGKKQSLSKFWLKTVGKNTPKIGMVFAIILAYINFIRVKSRDIFLL
ncbi:hypothetical protein CW705_02535 [Candidatus Bathyarchaeota archaeon]|nr:MAG: hypothetical protein CW705_02535 [Candidatus Bathyarchaeota archaeon]